MEGSAVKETIDTGVEETQTVVTVVSDKLTELHNKLPEIIVGLVEAIIVAVLFVLFAKLLMLINHKVMKRNAKRLSTTRAETVATILDDLIKYIIGIIAIIVILIILGVSKASIFGSVAIIGFILGTGGTALVADFLNGFFALFEGYYDVGDYIRSQTYEGTVVTLGVKSTVLLTPSQEIVTIPNSSILEVVNMAKYDYIHFHDICISYEADIEEVEKVINEKLLPEFEGNEVVKVVYLGVGMLNSSSVDLKFELHSDVQDRYEAQRIMNRTTKIVFDKNDIEIPFNQVVVTHKNQ